ncbi:unnamed protein product [Nyctereutes procyonoides]|uniref:(raccoon dog) hypothetical protein n=1 Tax=Nyctereutes procyonoides TaxID=34880 RepID=A0A811YVN6_NYCPR|nr:unnamed protein product [Nyctereutes procyonoides]
MRDRRGRDIILTIVPLSLVSKQVGPREARLCHNETPPRGPHGRLPPLPDSTGAFNFERPCYLRGGICLKRGTPNCEPFRGPCRAFTVCCKVKGSGRKWSSQGTLAPRAEARFPLSK